MTIFWIIVAIVAIIMLAVAFWMHNFDHVDPLPEDMSHLSTATLKGVLRAALTDYYADCDRALDHIDGGVSMAMQLDPTLGLRAREINKVAAELRKRDPEFPASWIDLKESP